jgi:hypothetical protein
MLILLNYIIIRWGCEHEKVAVETYIDYSKHHKGLIVKPAGFFINPEWPYIGASPDGIVDCDCCGRGTLEVKCPLCFKDRLPEDNEMFCMERINGKWWLKTNHSYYYQVQTQLHVCKVNYGHFVVWTENTIAVERIEPDYPFFNDILQSVKHLYIYGILPEIVGKWYTRKPIANEAGVLVSQETCSQQITSSSRQVEEVWCYCRRASFGRMIGCDNSDCTLEWFHFECLRLRSKPKGKWYCPSCRKRPQFNKNTGKQ